MIDPISHSTLLTEIRKSTVPSKKYEEELIIKAKRGSVSARNELVKSHMRFVLSASYTYGMSDHLVDLVSCGAMGLNKAIDTFDMTRGVKFISHASFQIKSELHKYVAENKYTIRLPANRHVEINKELALSKKDPEYQIKQEIAELLNLSGASIDTKVSGGSAGNDVSLHEVISKGDDCSYMQLESSCLSTELAISISYLTEQEQTVIKARYGLEGSDNGLAEVGELLGVSAERVRQIEKQALGKMRKSSKLKEYA